MSEPTATMRELKPTATTRELKPAQLSRLFTSLAMVYDSGLQLTEGFEVLQGAAGNPVEEHLYASLVEYAAEGKKLTESFAAIGGVPLYAQALLQVAETTGQMSVTCRALSTYYEKRDRLAQAIRSSLLYPLAMMVMIFIVVVMLLTQAMPIFDQVFAQFGFELGGLALAFLNVGTWLRGTAFWLSGCMVVLIIIGFVLTRLPAGRRFFAWLFEHNPLTGELSFRLSVSRLMLGMAAMLKSGMTPQSAIELAIDLVDDSRVKQRLEVLDKKIVEGMSFQVGLTQSGLIPKDSYLLIAIGFRTGSNAEAFAQIGENITASTERQMILLAAAIEPTLVALMTVLVGIILLSVMLPLLGVLASI